MLKKIITGTLLTLTAAAAVFLFHSRERRTKVTFPAEFTNSTTYCSGKEVTRLNFKPGDEDSFMDAVNLLNDCTRISLEEGTFTFMNGITIARSRGITIEGAGKVKTTIEFKPVGNFNGIDVESSASFTIRDLSVVNSPKNGIEIRQSENLHIDNVTVRWTETEAPRKSFNGAYGFYPVRVKNVLLENSESYYASDAGIYVGQCINAVVRGNTARHNVFGIEIENTINADVYNNTSENNTGGFLIYDHLRNDIVTRNIRVHDNTFINNNTDNFSQAGIVQQVPAGAGVVITAAREIEFFNNTVGGNNTVDIALVSGLVSEAANPARWKQKNFRIRDIHIHNNRFLPGSGRLIDNGKTDVKKRPLGKLFETFFGVMKEIKGLDAVPNIVYDGIDDGQTILTLTTWFGNNKGNHNRICLAKNRLEEGAPSLVDVNFPAVFNNKSEPTLESIRRAVTSGDVVTVNAGRGKAAADDDFYCSGYKATMVMAAGIYNEQHYEETAP